MKKLLTVLAAILLIMALLAGCGGSDEPAAEDGTVAEQESDSGSEADEEETSAAAGMPEGKRLAGLYQDMMKSGKYYMKYEAWTVPIEAADAEPQLAMIISIAFDGDDSDTMIESEGMGSFRNLSLNGVTYMINDADKTYIEMPETDEESAEGLDLLTSEDLELVDTGKDVVLGVTMSYEEYESGGETLRYYFDGDELYAFVVHDALGDLVMKVIELSDKIPSEMLKMPAGYINQMEAAFDIPTEGMSEEDIKALEEMMKAAE